MPLYSYSQLETFENCPLKYKFKYIDKIKKPEVQSIEAFVGGLVHKVLEKLYQDLVLRKLDSLDALLAHYRALWDQGWKPTIKIVRAGLTPENYFEYGAHCIRNYYRRHHPFDQSQTLDTEARVVFSLDAKGEYKMQGYIDRIARRADGTFEIHDYKTSRGLPSKDSLESDRQLGLYQIGLEARWPDAGPVELIWHYLGLDSDFHSARTPEQLRELGERTITDIRRITSEKEFLPRKSPLCDWCEYRADCPLWKHVDAVATLSQEEFSADAGVQLANDFAQTKFEIDRLAERLAELRAKIIEFARQNQATVLAGNGVEITVATREQVTFPGRDEPSRAHLELFLKKSGRWDEVTDLSLSRLLNVLEHHEWPPELLAQLRQFATSTPSATVRVARRGARRSELPVDDA